MKNNTISQAVIASILSVTATSWAQTSVGLGRADFKENCASCHGVNIHHARIPSSALTSSSDHRRPHLAGEQGHGGGDHQHHPHRCHYASW